MTEQPSGFVRIPHSRWERVKKEFGVPRVEDIAPVSGCYAIYLNRRLSYIGSTANLRSRLSDYQSRPSYGNRNEVLCSFGAFESISLKIKLSVVYGDWAFHEIRLIQRLQPRLNRHHSRQRQVA